MRDKVKSKNSKVKRLTPDGRCSNCYNKRIRQCLFNADAHPLPAITMMTFPFLFLAVRGRFPLQTAVDTYHL
jgi:hypothetical protein